MTQALRIAVVGGGSMGSNHVRVVSQHPGAELVAVVDPDEQRGRELAERFGVISFGSVAHLPRPDAVVVAVPTEHHRDVALPFIEAGIPILVEKPLAPELAQVGELVDVARNTGTPLMCGFVERFNPAVATALGLMEEPPIHVATVRHSPSAPRIRTSVVHDLLIHDVDLALRAVGTSVDGEVSSTSWASSAGVVELADCIVPFASGAIASLSASRLSQRKVRSVSIATESSLFEIDLLRHDLTVYRHRSQTQLDQGGPTYRAETVVDIPFVRHEGEPLALQLTHFIGLARGLIDPVAELDGLMAPHEVAAAVSAGPVQQFAGAIVGPP